MKTKKISAPPKKFKALNQAHLTDEELKAESAGDSKKWKVEHRFSYGWDDAGWTVEGEPQRFNSKNEAEDEIREHIKDQNEAFKRGYMDSKYRRSDYRAVRA